MNATTGGTGMTAGSPVPATSLLVLIALLTGAAVALLSLAGAVLQTAVVLGLALGLPALLLFLARPHLAVAGYLFLLPLFLDRAIVAGLNGGEILTAGMVVVGGIGLWEARDRVGTAIRAMAPLLWPLLGLAVVSVVSLIANRIGTFEEIASAVFKYLAFGAIVLLVHSHADTPRKRTTLLYGALAGAVVVAAYAVVSYLLGWSYDETYEVNRAYGTFDHWNLLGGFMVLMSFPILGLAAATRRIPVRLALAAAFVLEIIALLLSLTLGSIVALLTAVAFGLVFIIRVDWRRLVGIGSLMLIGFALVYLTNPLLQDKLTRFPERVMDRFRTYAVGISMFRDRFLLGFGSQERLLDALWFGDASYGLTAFGASSSVPHNAFLLMGVEKGFLGMLFFILLIAGALWIVFRNRGRLLEGRSALLYQGIVLGVVGFMVQNMTNNLVLHARVGILFFALVALVDRMAGPANDPAP